MSHTIVPFGKYKGHYLDELYEDKNYLLWFLSESNVSSSYREVFKELIDKLIISDFRNASSNRIQLNDNKGHSFDTSPAIRNKVLSSFMPPNDIEAMFSNAYGHEQTGEISNIIYFKDGITIQFDYSNANVKDFKKNHFLIELVGELDDNFPVIIEKFLNLTKEYPQSEKVIIADSVIAWGISETNIIHIFENRGIKLRIINPQHISNPKPNPKYQVILNKQSTLGNRLNRPFNFDNSDVPF